MFSQVGVSSMNVNASQVVGTSYPSLPKRANVPRRTAFKVCRASQNLTENTPGQINQELIASRRISTAVEGEFQSKKQTRRNLALSVSVGLATVMAGGWWFLNYTDGPAEVVDGDVIINGGRKQHLIGVDAPELNQMCTSKDGEVIPCGQQVKDYLQRFTNGRKVYCMKKVNAKWDGLPQSQCKFRYLGNEFDLSEQLSKNGLAYADDQYSAFTTQPYVKAMTEARRTGKGLWSGAFQDPATYRADHKASK